MNQETKDKLLKSKTLDEFMEASEHGMTFGDMDEEVIEHYKSLPKRENPHIRPPDPHSAFGAK